MEPKQVTSIREAIEQIKVVDHHEHLRLQFSEPMPHEIDLPYWLTHTYLSADLRASGLPEDVCDEKSFAYLRDAQADEAEARMAELEPYLAHVRSCSYYRYLLIAARDLYGFEGEEIEPHTWRPLSDAIRQANRDNPAWARSVLDRMNIHRILLDGGWWQMDPCPALHGDPRMAQVVRMDPLIVGDMSAAARISGRDFHSFRQYLEALDAAFDRAKREGAVAVKSGLAYRRILRYDKVAESDANRVFSRGLGTVDAKERKAFEDFMMHAVCERCQEYGFPLQIHTGIQAGNRNTVSNTDPTLLTNLFQEFPKVQFDVFHGGYPYLSEAGLLAKYFPNVYIDLCWLAHISPAAYQRALDEWVETVPANKILAWGGDHGIVDHSYASLCLAKDLVARVLARKVSQGYFAERNALHVAERIMAQNGCDLYCF